jgi:hypothetical protein
MLEMLYFHMYLPLSLSRRVYQILEPCIEIWRFVFLNFDQILAIENLQKKPLILAVSK